MLLFAEYSSGDDNRFLHNCRRVNRNTEFAPIQRQDSSAAPSRSAAFIIELFDDPMWPIFTRVSSDCALTVCLFEFTAARFADNVRLRLQRASERPSRRRSMRIVAASRCLVERIGDSRRTSCMPGSPAESPMSNASCCAKISESIYRLAANNNVITVSDSICRFELC